MRRRNAQTSTGGEREEAGRGEDHPETLTSIKNCAHLLEQLYRYDEVLCLYERMCAGYQRQLGDSHPTTVACLDEFQDMLSTIHGLESEKA